MTAVIRQQFIDPVSAERRVREMSVDIEIVRPDEACGLSSVIYMKVAPAPLPPHAHHNAPDFKPVFIAPEQLLSTLIDGKRTHTPLNCHRTRLTKELTEHWHLHVEDTSSEGLNAKKGDPVVVLSDLGNNPKKVYGFVADIYSDTHVELLVPDERKPRFYKGAFVENIANQWTKNFNVVGAKSQLSRPAHPTFAATRTSPKSVRIVIQVPLDNINHMIFYDVYVRDKPFSQVAPHWIPDASDLTSAEMEAVIETFNGGAEAGGGRIDHNNKKLFAVVISKDRPGQCNVNESECFMRPVSD